MRRFFSLSIVSLVSLSLSHLALAGKPTGKKFTGYVYEIVDGDGIWIYPTPNAPKQKKGQKKPGQRFRLVNIDTPETHYNGKTQGEWGDIAAEELKKLIFRKKIEVDDFGKDKYKRDLGRVMLDGKDINLHLVETGLAAVYLICDHNQCDSEWEKKSYVPEYLKACTEAEDKKLGIFGERKTDKGILPPLKQMPFEFRMAQDRRGPSRFLGDIETRRYYPPVMESFAKVPDRCKRIFFSEESHAIGAGFKKAE